MPTAYVLINYEIGAEKDILNKLKTVPGVIEASEVNGVYDIVVKIASGSLDSLKDTITRDIRAIDRVRSTMTLIVIEQKQDINNITKMSFGYNDIFWILSVILWTTGVTAIIILIMKRRGRTVNRPD